MSLPKIESPKYELKLPSNGKTVVYRPFTVKEQKILMMGQQGTGGEQFRAIHDILQGCCEDVDIDSLPSFDIEYMFLKLRTKSIGEESKLSYRCKNKPKEDEAECGATINYKLNLEEVEVVGESETGKVVKIDEMNSLVLKYPRMSEIEGLVDSDDEISQVVGTIASAIESVLHGEEVFSLKDQSPSEVEEFIEDLSLQTLDEIQKFIEDAPKLQAEIHLKCDKCGNSLDHKVEGLLNFF